MFVTYHEIYSPPQRMSSSISTYFPLSDQLKGVLSECYFALDF